MVTVSPLFFLHPGTLTSILPMFPELLIENEQSYSLKKSQNKSILDSMFLSDFRSHKE